MKSGKISESVLMRSVLRKIKTEREEVVCGAGIGVDCAVLSFHEDEESVFSTNPVSAPADMVCVYAVHRALNNLVAAGAELDEKALQDMMMQAENICGQYHVQIAGGHTEVSGAVNRPVLTVTGIGKRRKGDAITRGVKPGQDVVVSKWIGLDGTSRIAREHGSALLPRYPARMIEEAAGFEQFFSVIPEAATARKSGVCGTHDVSQGGIFGALWELAKGAGVGLEIDLRKLPVRQETIEICEFFDLNPYELSSEGCLLMTTGDGNGLVAALQKENIPAVVVGKITDSNDRVLFNGEEKRLLEPPKTDALYKIGKEEE